MTVTRYEITHSSTTTLTGDAPDYTAPFEPISTPEYCETTAQPVPTSTVEASGTRPPPVHTVTFITTDKNPAVVWESEPPPPGYTTDKGDNDDGGGGNTNPGNDHKPPQPTAAPPPPPPSGDDGSKPGFTITAKPSEVIINDSTVGGLKPSQTTTVVVDGGTFTIGPTAVVGQGTTVQRPAPAAAPGPTSAELGGMPVQASGSVVVVGGSTITVPAQGTAAYVGDKDVYAGPGTLIVDDETLTWSVADTPRQTGASDDDDDDEDASGSVDIVVAGGEMITALGQSVVVVHSTTITYGPGGGSSGGDEGITTVIGTDTIAIDENGVSLRGSTLGGPSALPAATTREIVGGVTVTRLGPSLVVVGGRTYTVGGGSRAAGATTTATVGGEAVTVGPQGVRVAGMTFGAPPPDEDAVVATIRPEDTASGDAPTETGSSDGGPGGGDDDDDDGSNEEDAAFSARPGITVIVSSLGLAFGAWAFM
ncbi:hypothetical protein N3K66_008067 [Trichothecium roseum]|uniref:Uncharacterized protein n=1 Tax=Trichothecium roseum TaxID=47278 RepID=A0ACC0UTK1_9HYPO|nr:hypothetical protein N3K66_008067 [Trichothecium roseum]